jgi:hypothetical protein
VTDGTFEVVVVDDAKTPSLDADSLSRPGFETLVLHSRGAGASAARNRGARDARAPIVLFLDDDMVAETDLVERHLAAQRGENTTAVVGAYPPAPDHPGLMASAVAFWWSDIFESMNRAVSSTFVFLLSGNLSIPRSAFLDLGGFAEDIPFRREDWELGMRWMQAGHEIVYEPRAIARHEFQLQTGARLRGAELEGYGDAVLAQRYPGVRGALPLVAHRPASAGGPVRRLGLALATRPLAQRLAGPALDVLERAHLRRAWLRLLKPIQIAAYTRGLARAGYVAADSDGETILECELLSDEPLRSGGPIAPTVRVTLRGEQIALVRPREGHWSPDVAKQIADAVGAETIELVAAARGWLPKEGAASLIERSVETITLSEGPPIETWHAAAERAERSQKELIALALHGAAATDHRWLTEALVAFDGDRVDAVFGLAVSDDRPLQALYLHDRSGSPAFAVGDAPDYLVIRTAVLRALGGIPADAARFGSLVPAMLIVERVIESGAVIGRRDVHGLVGGGVSAIEEGRAWGLARVATSNAPSRALVRGGAGIVATAAWEIFKHGGRVDRNQMGALVGAAQGGLRGAVAARGAVVRGARKSSGGAAADRPRQADAHR